MATSKLYNTTMHLNRLLQNYVKQKRLRRSNFRLRTRHGIFNKTPPTDWQFVRGDIVEVIRGRDEGKQGKILRVYRSGETCVIDGINLRITTTRDSTGKLITMWKPSRVFIKNIALVDQDTGLPTPIEWKYQGSLSDKKSYQRVRQSTISGDIIIKQKEAKPVRKLREPHPEKDTKPSIARKRTWIGPWEFFTNEQKEYIYDHCNKYKSHIPNIIKRLPELIYNNAEEVQEYIKLLPPLPHTMFHPGTCLPYTYENKPTPNWSINRIRRSLSSIAYNSSNSKKMITDELIQQIKKHDTFPAYYSHPIDKHHYWPRIPIEEDPKFIYHKLNDFKQQNNNQDNQDNYEDNNENDNNEDNEDKNNKKQ